MKEKALLAISGKVLEKPFSLDAIGVIRSAVERALSERDVLLTECIVTLEPSKFLASSFFMSAGFVTAPADDEDLQAAALVMRSVMSPNSPDEVVVMLGEDEPVNFLRAITGRARRTLLRLSGPEDAGVSEQLAQSLEGVLDIRELLSKEGVSWDDYERHTWDGWSDQFEQFLSVGSGSGPTPRAPETEPLGGGSGADVDELTNLPDELTRFTESAPKWNEALVALLLANEMKCSAYKATEQLDRDFPGINSFYLKRRGDFEKLLCDQVRLTVDDNGGASLCHVDHSDLAPVDPAAALSQLSLGSGGDAQLEVQQTYVEPKQEETPDFDDVKEQALFMQEICEWALERRRIVAEKGFATPAAVDRDQEYYEGGRMLSLYIWPLSYHANHFDDAEMQNAADAYGHLADSMKVLKKAFSLIDEISNENLVKALSLAAAAQCLVKTILLRNKVVSSTNTTVISDQVQRNAYRAVKGLTHAYVGGKGFVQYLQFSDAVDPQDLPELRKKLDAFEQELDSVSRQSKGRKKVEGRLNYSVTKLRDDVSDVYQWGIAIEAVTALCQDFGEKPSSVALRELFVDIIDKIPESVELTDEFCNVVQAIEVYKALEQEKAEAEANAGAEETPDSPAVQAVREHYRGSKVVFIGGIPQEHIIARLQSKFEIELLWSVNGHGKSLKTFNPYLNDPDVKLFLVYIPWCSHKHSEELAVMARDANKDFVRLPKGTNPEKIATVICGQIKDFEGALDAKTAE